MQNITDYSVHDILTFRIIREKGYNFRDRINMRYSHFQVDTVDNPDITLIIGGFSPDNQACYLVDYQYHVKQNYFYCRDAGGGANWEIEVIGLEDKNTTVNFHVRNGFGLRRWMNPDFLPQVFLLKMIEHKLSQKGYFLLHSAAVANAGRGYLLCGRGSSYKSTICMDLVRKSGFGVLGDDRTIVSKGRVLNFMADTSSPAMFQFLVEHLDTENSWNMLKQAEYLRYVRSQNTSGGNNVVSKATPAGLILLARCSENTAVSIDKVIEGPETTAARLISNTGLEDYTRVGDLAIDSAPFQRYLQAYSYVFPNSTMASAEKNRLAGLSNVLRGLPVYLVKIPRRYTGDIHEKIHRLLLSLARGENA